LCTYFEHTREGALFEKNIGCNVDLQFLMLFTELRCREQHFSGNYSSGSGSDGSTPDTDVQRGYILKIKQKETVDNHLIQRFKKIKK
jgi:hypothetical protein